MPYFHKTPIYVQWLYPGLTWRKRSGKKILYLTFDDGPVPEATPDVLEILSNKGVKASFFCVGDNIKKHPELFLQIIKEDHVVANHTFNHLDGWDCALEEYVDNVELCKKEMEDQNIKSRMFRPPYGKINRKQIKTLKKAGYDIIMWDVLSGDFDANLSAKDCLKKSINATSDGSIIIFHDSIKSIDKVRKVLPSYIDHFQNEGFTFATL